MFRDFCEAYMLAPVAELMAPQLLEQFNVRALVGQIKELPLGGALNEPTDAEPSRAEPLQAATTKGSPDLAQSSAQEQDAPHAKVLRMGERSRSQTEELTPERKEELRQKLARELSARGIPRWAGGLE
jgi:flagellar motor protein MotB